MKRKSFKLLLFIVLVILVVLFFVFDLGHYLTLDFLKTKKQAFDNFYGLHPALTICLYMAVYILVTGLSLPGATVMTLAGGALFGLWTALFAVSFASTIGATLAFLAARFLLRDWVQEKFGDKLRTVNEGVRSEGAFYLFSLRLVPIFPFFVINLAMALTPIRALTFYWVSQLGMLPGTFVYVNAGTRLGQIESASGILSPGLIFSFVLLGLFPLIAKRILAWIQRRRTLGVFPAPEKFDYNVVVIGAGSGGLVSAYIAAAVRAKVALIEKGKMGGDCLNTGCVPSKALIRSSRILSHIRRAKEFGLREREVEVDFPAVMERVQRVIGQVAPHDSVERYTGLGVDCFSGEAKIVSPFSVQVGDRTLTTRNIILATGATPFIPPIPGLEEIEYLTSENLWEIRHLPKRLVVLGGGPIGCEMTQAFARLGAEVTQVEMASRIMGREDPDVSEFVEKKFAEEGIKVLAGHRALEIVQEDGEKILVCEQEGRTVRIPFDRILVAVGRKARVQGYGLEELGVKITDRGTVAVDPFLRTNFPNIFAVGDVAGPYQFTHTAGHMAWYASVNALFGGIRSFKVDYSVVPWCTFTDPEVARVGLSEEEARVRKVPHEVTRYDLADLDRAIAEEEAVGWVKVLTKPGSDKILGATIVGTHAGDLLAEFVLAMKQHIGLNKILGTIHAYPTLAEANKMAAGVWKKEHAPEGLLSWLERFHAWRRGK